MACASAALDLISQRKAGIGHPENGPLTLSLRDLHEETVQAIANHLLKDFHSLSDASLTNKAVCVAESMLQSSNLQEGTEFTNTEGQAEPLSMFDGMVQWKPLMEKLIEQDYSTRASRWKTE